jgi:hypothetical protein
VIRRRIPIEPAQEQGPQFGFRVVRRRHWPGSPVGTDRRARRLQRRAKK